MKAFVVKKYWKNQLHHFTDFADPIINENEVLVQIHATAINPLDIIIRNGDFKLFLPYKPLFINGHDMAGIVTKIGSKVTKFKVGDEVYSRPRDHKIGTFAELIAVNENDLAIKPKNISMEEAASIPLVWLTSWQALVEIANVKKGQKVFIQAGSWGAGSFAIQLAKYLGAFVATTVSSSNIDLVKNLGADLIIDYKKEDYSNILKDYDVVIHSSKEPKMINNSLKILKKGWVLISLTWPVTKVFAKQVWLNYFFQFIMWMISRNFIKKAEKLSVNFKFLFMKSNWYQLSKITKLIEEGKILPVIDKIYSFNQLNEAISYVETWRSKWKVVVKVK